MADSNKGNVPTANKDGGFNPAWSAIGDIIATMKADEERPLADTPAPAEVPTDLSGRPLGASGYVGSTSANRDEKTDANKKETGSSSPTAAKTERIEPPEERLYQYYVAASKAEEEENAEAVEKRKEEHERFFPGEFQYDADYPRGHEEKHLKEQQSNDESQSDEDGEVACERMDEVRK